jgi:hypothetical protein
MRLHVKSFLAAGTVIACLSSASARAQDVPGASATVEHPKARTASNGQCRILSEGTLMASWGRKDLPLLAFTIGPKAAMADEMHANKAPFTGPGHYPDVILAVALGKTATEDAYGGLGSITMNPDGRTGTFKTNDGKSSGRFDCGAPPKRT